MIPDTAVEQARRVILRTAPPISVAACDELAAAVLTATLPALRRHIVADIAAGVEDGACIWCAAGEHGECTRGDCACWQEPGTHSEGGGVR